MKHFNSLLWMLAFTAASTVLVACGDDDNNSPATNDPAPVEPTKEEAMSQAKQKEYLETIAKEFMNQTPSSDFQELADLANYVRDTYIDDYDWDDVEDWAQDAFDAARRSLGTTDRDASSSYTTYLYNNYEALIFFSNFTSHFEASNGRWVQSKANDLQFSFKDKNNNQCVLTLQSSGSVKNVHIVNVRDFLKSDYTVTPYVREYDLTKVTIGIPENIVVTLTKGGTQLVKTTVKINLASLVGEEFDLSASGITASVLTELSNGYKIEVSEVKYTANSKASAVFAISKNGTSLVSGAVASDISGIPSANVSVFNDKNFDIDDYNTDNANAKNAVVKLDVLGKLQIQGTVTDVRKFAEYIEDARDNDDKEQNFKSYVNQANGLIDLNLFYDNKATKQATVKLEPFQDNSWKGVYWKCEPVIYFFDGSSYSTFEAFFNDKDFKAVIDDFKNLANRYANLVDERIDW